MRRFSIVLLAGFFLHCILATPPAAAEPSISATVDRTVIRLDEQLTLELSIAGGKADMPDSLPDIPNFSVRSAGRSESISIINGSMTSSTSLRFILSPRAAGKYTIPPIVMQAKGKAYQTQPISVEVLAAGAAAPQQAAQSAQVAPTADAPVDGRALFITAAVDKPTAYVNEKIVYTFKFYRRVNLLSNPNYTPADFSGFWKEDMPAKNYQTVLNGQRYLVNEMQLMLFPTRAGTFNLGTATLQCQVEDINPADPFAAFGSLFSGGRTHELKTSPVSVKVLPLPETGKPKDFNGTVGAFTLNATLDKRAAKVNEPVTLIITVAGAGSIKTIAEPKLPDWPDFRKYETVNTTELDKKDGALGGSKTFKTVIVPLTPGKKTIQPIAFSFFNPAEKQYRTLLTPVLTLDVMPGDPAAAPLTFGGPQSAVTPAATAIAVVNADIRYIKTLRAWRPYRGPLYGRGWFILINTLPVAGVIIVLAFMAWTRKLTSDVAFARKLRAGKTARKYLRSAKKALSAGDSTPAAVISFYTAVARALLEYIAHKLNVSPEGLTGAAIAGLLAARGIPAPVIEETKRILVECDLVRFAPTTVAPEMMRAVFKQTEILIEELDRKI